MQRATPTPYMTVESISQVKRQVFCRHYDSCLDIAIEKRWRGFSCEKCQGFEHETFDEKKIYEEHSRCMNFVFACGALDPERALAH